ncbi:MAG: sugar phosphate isomerase/epimerase family protein [Pirellulales bacterium]
MSISRRQFMKKCAAAAAPIIAESASAMADEPTKTAERDHQTGRLGIVIHSYGIRRGHRPSGFADPLVFLEYCRKLGAGGVQVSLGRGDDAFVGRVTDAVRASGMYLEGIAGLPRDQADVARFNDELRTAKECGATVVRTVMLSGRRYETFDSADAFRKFADRSWQSLVLAKPVVERHGVRLAVENHKDWRVPELLGILKRIDSPNIGVTLDTGNSIALLEEPHEVVEAYAPYTFTLHFKDMAVAEYNDGFLLSEVPLGTGFVDLARIIKLVRDKRPEANFNLEMITRDPLRVPCLGTKYWATFADLPAKELARTLAMVRDTAAKQPLPRISDLSLDDKLAREDENVRASLQFARQRLFA